MWMWVSEVRFPSTGRLQVLEIPVLQLFILAPLVVGCVVQCWLGDGSMQGYFGHVPSQFSISMEP